MIKLIVPMMLLLLTLNACAMGGKPMERKENDKMYHPCHAFEVESPVGKFCNNTCVKRKFGPGSKCKEWKRTVKDFSSEKDFMFFKDGTFVLIDEDQLK